MQKPLGTLLGDIAVIVVILALMAGGVWLFSEGKNDAPATVVSRVKAQNRPVRPLASPEIFDADSDGLRDWEEALWGTLAEKADTDGDGTADGAEVAERRNPSKAGPNDSLDGPLTVAESLLKEPKIPSSLPVTALPDPARPSTTGARKNPGETPDIENRDATKDSLRSFGNAVGALIQRAVSDPDAELAFWNRAAGNTKMNGDLIRGFTALAQKYLILAADIASVAVPAKGAEVHAALATAYQNYARAIRVIAETPLDSYMSASSITAYSDSTLALGHAVVAVSDLFYKEGVVFSRTEPGSIFMFPR